MQHLLGVDDREDPVRRRGPHVPLVPVLGQFAQRTEGLVGEEEDYQELGSGEVTLCEAEGADEPRGGEPS